VRFYFGLVSAKVHRLKVVPNEEENISSSSLIRGFTVIEGDRTKSHQAQQAFRLALTWVGHKSNFGQKSEAKILTSSISLEKLLDSV